MKWKILTVLSFSEFSYRRYKRRFSPVLTEFSITFFTIPQHFKTRLCGDFFFTTFPLATPGFGRASNRLCRMLNATEDNSSFRRASPVLDLLGQANCGSVCASVCKKRATAPPVSLGLNECDGKCPIALLLALLSNLVWHTGELCFGRNLGFKVAISRKICKQIQAFVLVPKIHFKMKRGASASGRLQKRGIQ